MAKGWCLTGTETNPLCAKMARGWRVPNRGARHPMCAKMAHDLCVLHREDKCPLGVRRQGGSDLFAVPVSASPRMCGHMFIGLQVFVASLLCRSCIDQLCLLLRSAILSMVQFSTMLSKTASAGFGCFVVCFSRLSCLFRLVNVLSSVSCWHLFVVMFALWAPLSVL